MLINFRKFAVSLIKPLKETQEGHENLEVWRDSIPPAIWIQLLSTNNSPIQEIISRWKEIHEVVKGYFLKEEIRSSDIRRDLGRYETILEKIIGYRTRWESHITRMTSRRYAAQSLQYCNLEQDVQEDQGIDILKLKEA